MSVIESVTLMFALVLSANLLYWSKNKWGVGLTAALIITATTVSFAWPLLLGLGAGLGLILLLNKFRPELARGEGRENVLREWIQHTMALSMLLVGIQFVVYYSLLASGTFTALSRPDVVDAFLPIAGGLEIKAILTLNLWDKNHPAAAVMLTTVLLSGILCKRAFCGWLCPLGFAGTKLYNLRIRYFKGTYLPPAWLDWPLRMVKYLLLTGLLYVVVLAMPAQALPHYLNGFYMKVADLKTAMFFINPGIIGGILIALTLIMAAWQNQAFCRYLCPYGAALGLLSFLSPFKVRRDTNHCLNQTRGINCDKCTRACPSRIQVHVIETVRTDECQACMRCINACPEKKALGIKTRWGKQLSARGLLVILLLLMFGLPLIAYTFGFWHSEIADTTKAELMNYLHQISH